MKRKELFLRPVSDFTQIFIILFISRLRTEENVYRTSGSSADKKALSSVKQLYMLLMYILNSWSPMTEPWRTSVSMFRRWEKGCSVFTTWVLFFRKDEIYLFILPALPNVFNLNGRDKCCTSSLFLLYDDMI